MNAQSGRDLAHPGIAAELGVTSAGSRLSTNAALALALTLPRHDDATTRRFKKDHEEHEDHKENLRESLRRILPAGGAALRAVAGARVERIANGRFVALAACDPLDSHSCDAGRAGRRAASGGEPLICSNLGFDLTADRVGSVVDLLKKCLHRGLATLASSTFRFFRIRLTVRFHQRSHVERLCPLAAPRFARGQE